MPACDTGGMSTERFSYSGPAIIDGVTYPSVLLTENPLERGLRSWEGSVSFAQENAPEGFTPDLGSGTPVAVDLPDGYCAEFEYLFTRKGE